MYLKFQLKHYLETFQITAAELARQTGVSKQSLSDWLGGITPNSIENLKRVADFFKVSVDELCFGETYRYGVGTKHVGGTPESAGLNAFQAAQEGANQEYYFCAGADGRIREPNQAFQKLTGWSALELEAFPMMFFVHHSDRFSVRLRVLSLMKAESISADSFDFRFLCKDGSIVWFRGAYLINRTTGVLFAQVRDVTHLYSPTEDPKVIATVCGYVREAFHLTKLRYADAEVAMSCTDSEEQALVRSRHVCLAAFFCGLFDLKSFGMTAGTPFSLEYSFDREKKVGRFVFKPKDEPIKLSHLHEPAYQLLRFIGEAAGGTVTIHSDCHEITLTLPGVVLA